MRRNPELHRERKHLPSKEPFRNREYRADLRFRLRRRLHEQRVRRNGQTTAKGHGNLCNVSSRTSRSNAEGGLPDMSGGFGADADVMARASSQVDEVKSNIEQAVRQLQSNVEPVLGSWQGQAATVFRRLMDAFQENAHTITSKLDEIGQNIRTSGQTYSQKDEEHQQQLSSIESMLNG
jgi:WXG100 family type VII secretion target